MISLTTPGTQLQLVIEIPHKIFDPKLLYQRFFSNAQSLGEPSTAVVHMETGKAWEIDNFLANFPFEGDATEEFRWGEYYVSCTHGPSTHPFTLIRMWGDMKLWSMADRILSLFVHLEGLRCAYVVNHRFHRLQSCDRREIFRHYGEPLEAYALVDNDLPPPYREMIGMLVDVTKNPGRCIRRLGPNGYTEFVAAKMWFGESFWPLVGKTKDSFTLDPALGTVSEVGHGVLRIEAADKPFDSVSQQDKLGALRLAIYGEASKKLERNTWSVGG
jgi:hypothetical protein